MILPQNTQVLNEENQLSIATKEQEGDIVASGGETDLTCLVGDELAVKVVNIDGEAVTTSKTSTEVLTDGNKLATNVSVQDGDVLATGGKTGLTCLMDNNQTALKTVTLDGEIVASGNKTCLVNVDGKNQLALKIFGGVSDWRGKPADWSDIRTDCPENSIALYAAHPSDFSSYDNLGFAAYTSTGGYNVFIDGIQYGTTYSSGARCNITWSTSGITTGDYITTPSLMKAHKIWIEPATEGATFTAFSSKRIAASGNEAQGILWAHFNIDNTINLYRCFSEYNVRYNPILQAVTAKNNLIKISGIGYLFSEGVDLYTRASNLDYAPVFDLQGKTMSGSGAFAMQDTATLKRITLKNGTITDINAMFANARNLEKITLKNATLALATSGSPIRTFLNNYKLKKLPPIDYTSAGNIYDFLTNAESLEDTVLDTRQGTSITRIGCYGDSSHFMGGFKGLRVSNSAPFSNATAPQINVSYTGMDRAALVQLFNDLPTVSSGQVINITGCTGSEDLLPEDVSIATTKGWTVTGGPQFTTYYRYKHNDTNIYTTDSTPSEGHISLQNATAVGTLTESAGIYSNFSGSSYIDIPKTLKSTNNASYIFNFKTSTFSHSQKLIHSDVMISVEIDTNGQMGTYDYGARVLRGNAQLEPFSEYYVKIDIDGTNKTFSFKKATDANYTQIWSGTDTGMNTAVNYPIRIGNDSNNPDNYVNFLGSVNMHNSSIEIDNVKTTFGDISNPSEIFDSSFNLMNPQPYFNYKPVGLDNATIKGSLTQNDTQFTGFSSSNNINVPLLNYTTHFEGVIHAKTPSSINENGIVMSNGYGLNLRREQGGVNIMMAAANSSRWDVVVGFDTGIPLNETSTELWIKWRWDSSDNIWTFYQSSDGNSWTQRNSRTITGKINFAGGLGLGGGSLESYNWADGIVYADDCYFICDDTRFDLWNPNSQIIINNDDYIYDGSVLH